VKVKIKVKVKIRAKVKVRVCVCVCAWALGCPRAQLPQGATTSVRLVTVLAGKLPWIWLDKCSICVIELSYNILKGVFMSDWIKNLVCIVDFAGNNRDAGFWADWSPDDKRLYFGGAWTNVPSMPCEVEPTDEQAYAWVKAYDEGLL